MSNSPFEIPSEMRDFAERSVDQARKAFEGFLAVAQKTAGVTEGAPGATPGVKALSAHVLSYTEQNVNAAFELAHSADGSSGGGDGIEVTFEIFAAQFVDVGAFAGKTAGLEVAVFHNIVVHDGKRLHGVSSY